MQSTDTTTPSRTSPRSRLPLAAALLACAVAVVVLATSATATPPIAAGRTPSLQKDVDSIVQAGVPGAILVVRDRNHTFRYTSGVSDIESGRAMRAGDHFKIASLTKSYTAAVVLQLVGEGKLRLNQSVEHWLPGLVPNGDGITIRNLLQHTSGLFDFEADERVLQPYLQGDFGHYWSPLELVQMALSHEPLFAPGAGQSYSNTNYILLGMVIEAIDRKSIGEALNDRLFEPLHLDKTSYPTEPGLPSPYAHGYLILGDGTPVDVTGISPSLSPASGAIEATAVDVADFYRALLSGDVLKPKLLRAMKATIPVGTPGDIPGQRYGLGLERFPTSCGPAWGHNGAVPGYLSYSFNSGNGARQALLMVNLDASSFPQEAADLYFELLEKAFCSVA